MFEHTIEVLNQYAKEVEQKYKQRLLDNGRKATGNLITSVKCNVSNPDSNQQIQVVLNLEKYWEYVEYDTRKHWAPIEPLLNWVEKKQLIPDEKIKGLPVEKQNLAMAYGVQHKIAEEGTKGTHDLSNTLQECNQKYVGLITRAIKEDVLGNIKLFFSEFSSIGF